tara:strand:- start:786 stop:1025 length:240 start_codon:yes stop_codon:yes gene_type:complete
LTLNVDTLNNEDTSVIQAGNDALINASNDLIISINNMTLFSGNDMNLYTIDTLKYNRLVQFYAKKHNTISPSNLPWELY